MGPPFPTALTIAGSDSGGGAGVQADLKTFTALGVFGASVVTALTAQNTLGVQAVHTVPPDFVAQQMDSVLTDIPIRAAKTGMLVDAAIVEVVAAKIRQYQVRPLVVDPVMVAKSGDRLLADGAVQALIRQLLPLATLITPNLGEAELLLGSPVRDLPTMREAAKRLFNFGCGAVLVKGGHLPKGATDVLYDGEEVTEFPAPHLDTQNTHGTGCTLSAAVAGYLAQALPLRESVRAAKEFITEAIAKAPEGLGTGHGPLHHMHRIRP